MNKDYSVLSHSICIFVLDIDMASHKNIVHQYFKKEIEGGKILVKVNPIHLTGTELIIDESGALQTRDLEFDDQIFDDLKHDGFTEVNAMEFNIYLSGLL